MPEEENKTDGNVQQKTEGEKQEAPAGNSDEGNKPAANSLIDGANAAAKRLEDANRKTEELIKRQEEIYTKTMLGGRAEAGQSKPLSVEEQAKQKIDEEVKALKEKFYT